MKKSLLLLSIFITTILSAQTELIQGKIISKQRLVTENEQVQAQFDMMGKMESVTLFKNGNSFTELDNPMSGKVTTIINEEQKEMLLLMDNPAMGKLYSKQSTTPKEEDLKNTTVTKGDKTKTILGYECKEYKVSSTTNGVTSEMTLFTTEELNIPTQQTAMLQDKVPGFPLYMEIKMNQMGIEMVVITEVKSIDEQEVKDDLFNTTPPDGYKSM